MADPTAPSRPPVGGARSVAAGISTPNIDALRAAAVAYRRVMGETLQDLPARAAAEEAWRAAGGDPSIDLAPLLVDVASRHSAWFWAPAHRRVAWEERCLRSRGIWPPPLDRALWPPIPPVPDGWEPAPEAGLERGDRPA